MVLTSISIVGFSLEKVVREFSDILYRSVIKDEGENSDMNSQV